MSLTLGTVCSGIGAPEYAASLVGWKHIWCSEIEKFPSAVLAHHFPGVPNLGDMRTIAERIRKGEIEPPDVLCGGTPCQSFSVAGLRKGLADERGQLIVSFIDILDACDEVRRSRGLEPTIAVWENVPGVFTSGGGADFGAFLGGLSGAEDAIVSPSGKWPRFGFVAGQKRVIAWRTLDSQHHGVAQRRRRVWLVAQGNSEGDARNWRTVAGALFPFNKGEARYADTGGKEGEDSPRTPEESPSPIIFEPRSPDGHPRIITGNVCPTLNRMGGGQREPCVAYRKSCRLNCKEGYETWVDDGLANTINRFDLGDRDTHVIVSSKLTVRRLTPKECERLQAFPDNWTYIPYGKAFASDGLRYSALGNSMTTTIPTWIFQNITKKVTHGKHEPQ